MSWNTSGGFQPTNNSSWGSGGYSSNVTSGQPQDAADIFSGGTNCTQTDQCGSGYQCIGGRCVRRDELGNSTGAPGDQCGTQTGGDNSPGSGGGGCGGGSAGGGQVDRCTTASPGDCLERGTAPRSYSSTTTGCGNPGGGGGGNSTISDEDECDSFCEAWGENFGEALPGCPPPCGDCEECSIFGECRKKRDGGCGCDSSPPSACAVCTSSGSWSERSCDPPPQPPSPGCWYDSQCGKCEFCNATSDDVRGECIPSQGCKTCTRVTVAGTCQGCASWVANGMVFGPRDCVTCSGSTSNQTYFLCGALDTSSWERYCGRAQCTDRTNAPCGCCAPSCGRNCYWGNFYTKSWYSDQPWFEYSRRACTYKISVSVGKCPSDGSTNCP